MGSAVVWLLVLVLSALRVSVPVHAESGSLKPMADMRVDDLMRFSDPPLSGSGTPSGKSEVPSPGIADLRTVDHVLKRLDQDLARVPLDRPSTATPHGDRQDLHPARQQFFK